MVTFLKEERKACDALRDGFQPEIAFVQQPVQGTSSPVLEYIKNHDDSFPVICRHFYICWFLSNVVITKEGAEVDQNSRSIVLDCMGLLLFR